MKDSINNRGYVVQCFVVVYDEIGIRWRDEGDVNADNISPCSFTCLLVKMFGIARHEGFNRNVQKNFEVLTQVFPVPFLPFGIVGQHGTNHVDALLVQKAAEVGEPARMPLAFLVTEPDIVTHDLAKLVAVDKDQIRVAGF